MHRRGRIRGGWRRGPACWIARIRGIPSIRRIGGSGRIIGLSRPVGRNQRVRGDRGERSGDRWRAWLGEWPGRGRNGRGREHSRIGERARVRNHHRLPRPSRLGHASWLGNGSHRSHAPGSRPGPRLRDHRGWGNHSWLRKRRRRPPPRQLLPPRWPTVRRSANGCLPLRPGCWQVSGPGERGSGNRKESVRNAVLRSPLPALTCIPSISGTT